MIARKTRYAAAAIFLPAFWLLASCSDDGDGGTIPQPTPECTDSVTVSVNTADSLPLFSWSPDCLIGRLIVEEGGIEERWGTETNGLNVFRSPIRYSVHPPETPEDQQTDPAQPLFPGHTYTVTLFRWITFTPTESLQVLAVKTFTPPTVSPPVRAPEPRQTGARFATEDSITP